MEDHDPSEGSVGYLTWEEFNRLGWAVQNAMKHVSWWRVCGHVRSGDPDERIHRSREHALPLPAAWLAATEVSRLLGELNRWPELEDAAADMEGQWFCLELIREVETAMARWPIEDRPHRVQFIRCMACDRLTLKYFPPSSNSRDDATTAIASIRVGDELRPVELRNTVVKCTERDCGAVLDEGMWLFAVALKEAEELERKRRLDSRRAGGGAGESASGDGVPVAGGSEREYQEDASGEGPVAVPA